MSQRIDLFTNVHKGLRKAMFDLSYLAGRTDYNDVKQLEELKSAFDEVFSFLHKHGYNEDNHMLPLLDTKVPGASQHDMEDHVEIEKKIASLTDEMHGLSSIPQGGERIPAGYKFYLNLNKFISEYLLHMHEEETVTTGLFYDNFSDEELSVILPKIISSSKPEDLLTSAKYMIPSMNDDERLFLLGGMKKAPEEFFNKIKEIAKKKLSEEEYNKLGV
jgi:hypothetical protein